MSEMFKGSSTRTNRPKLRLLALTIPCLYWIGLPTIALLGWGWGLTEKVLTTMILPAGMMANLLLIGWALHFWFAASRWRSILWFAAFVVWCTICSPLLIGSVIRSIETPWVDVKPEGEYDWVAILGGGVSVNVNEQPQLNKDGQRVILGVQLYHSGMTKRLISLGGGVKGMTASAEVGQSSNRELLESLQIPSEVIFDVHGNTTKEEIAAIKKFLQEQNAEQDRVAMITSAYHMDRAVRLAKNAGLKVEPLPTAFMMLKARAVSPIDLVPNSEAFHNWSALTKEFLAGWVRR